MATISEKWLNLNHKSKDYEDWPCIECGRMLRFLKPMHGGPPQVKCKKCEKEN